MTRDLTLAQMRADIAAILHEEPDAIGEQDSLMDLGLDSMRAMNLVVKWAGETGLALELSDLAEDVTLAGWWAVIRALQDARR